MSRVLGSSERLGTAEPTSTEARSTNAYDDSLRRRFAEIEDNLQRGDHEADAGRWDQAVQFYERILRDHPQHAVAHHRAAMACDRCGDFAAAERHYLAALEALPNDVEILNDLGYSYFLQGRFPESEQALRRALDIEPRHQLALNNLGMLYGAIGDTPRAMAVLRVSHSEAEAQSRFAVLMQSLDEIQRLDSSALPPIITPRSTELHTAEVEPNAGLELSASSDAAAVNRSAAKPLPGLIDPAGTNVRPFGLAAGEVGPHQPYRRQRPTTEGDGAEPANLTATDSDSAAPHNAIELPLWIPPNDESAGGSNSQAGYPSRNEPFPIINRDDIRTAGIETLSTSKRREPIDQLPPPVFLGSDDSHPVISPAVRPVTGHSRTAEVTER